MFQWPRNTNYFVEIPESHTIGHHKVIISGHHQHLVVCVRISENVAYIIYEQPKVKKKEKFQVLIISKQFNVRIRTL